MQIKQGRMGFDSRLQTINGPGNQTALYAIFLPFRQCLGAMVMLKAWLIFFMCCWQGNPGLYAMHVCPMRSCILQTLTMGNTFTGSHPVDLMRTNLLSKAQAIAMSQG